MAAGYILQTSVIKSKLVELIQKESPRETHSLQKLASFEIIMQLGYDLRQKDLFDEKLKKTNLTLAAQDFITSCLY